MIVEEPGSQDRTRAVGAAERPNARHWLVHLEVEIHARHRPCFVLARFCEFQVLHPPRLTSCGELLSPGVRLYRSLRFDYVLQCELNVVGKPLRDPDLQVPYVLTYCIGPGTLVQVDVHNVLPPFFNASPRQLPVQCA